MYIRGARVLVCGGGGFIGGHMVNRLLEAGAAMVRAVDVKPFSEWHQINPQAENLVLDLQLREACHESVQGMDTVIQLAADMGGMGFIENNKALCMLSVLISTHMLVAARDSGVKRFFYSSSACIYPEFNQMDPDNPVCTESSAYPAGPDSEYGWEKLFSERLYLSYMRNYGVQVRIARFHNIFGPDGTWDGGKEKAPAALCRKVAQAPERGEIEIWGDGKQTRSFLYVDECVEGVRRLMESDFTGPVNIGSEEMVTINQLAELVMDVAGKELSIHHIKGPLGVRGRNSDNKLIFEKLGWRPNRPLREGLEKTYAWIANQVEMTRAVPV
jgi:nucleoside-diphosphate-sugar epimerase